MKSVILIEREKAKNSWRIVSRQCTETGLSKRAFERLGSDYPDLDWARDHADWLKRRKHRQPRLEAK